MNQLSKNTTVVNTEVLLPAVDVIEDAGGITLWADLPGVARENIKLHVEGDTLIIEGEVTLELPPAMEMTHQEVPGRHFHRAFTLSKELDPNRIQAGYAQGVLSLRIPKMEQAQPRRISIKVM